MTANGNMNVWNDLFVSRDAAITRDLRVQRSLSVTQDSTLNNVRINGNLTIPTGAANGRVLTSNGAGQASWQPVTGSAGGSMIIDPIKI
jgi:hypothetical protein